MISSHKGFWIAVLVLAPMLAWADGDPESLSACEPKENGLFGIMCICARSVGDKVDHKDLSTTMPKYGAFPGEKECEAAAAPDCDKLCKAFKW